MFTGIITDIGTLVSLQTSQQNHRMVIQTQYDTSTIALGASIACSGCCLTVVEKTATTFAVDVSAETLRCTTLAGWREGTKINLERALKLGDELGGHMVSGHVDGLATINIIEKGANEWRIECDAPVDLARFIVAKGSVTLDGISLTVNSVATTRFSVNIIPHTLRETTLGLRAAGDMLNLEIDMLARYVARLNEQ